MIKCLIVDFPRVLEFYNFRQFITAIYLTMYLSLYLSFYTYIYFRELPSPLMGEELYTDWLEAANLQVN